MKNQIDMALKLRRMVTIAHHIPGRIRLKYKLGILAHLARFNAQEIEDGLASVPAFKSYRLNHATNSILIEYDASVVPPVVINALFSEVDAEAENACVALGQLVETNGVNR